MVKVGPKICFSQRFEFEISYLAWNFISVIDFSGYLLDKQQLFIDL